MARPQAISAQKAMSRALKIPNQLQDRIIENLFNEVGSCVAFRSCSLVSKRWLHLSRTKYFSREKVLLFAQEGPCGLPSKRFKAFYGDDVGGLQKFLIESGPKCPLWPYIQRIEIHDGTMAQFLGPIDVCGDGFVHSAINFALKSLRCAKKLSSLYLWGFNVPKFQDKLTERIQANSSLSILHISHSAFTPGAFLRFLNSLGERNLDIKLTGVSFDRPSKDFRLPSLGDLPTNPTLKLVINTFNKYNDYAGSVMLFKLILRHRWNVTALHLADCVLCEGASSSLIPSVVRHIGSSLEELSIPIPTLLEDDVFLPPLSLSTNTSLKKLRLGELFGSENDQEMKKIVESLLSTIHSKEQFSELTVEVTSHWLEDEAKEKVEWDSLEDILLDKERFPGSGPLLVLGQNPYNDEAVPLDLVKNISFPRLVDAGNLKSWIYNPPY